jgi:hypothetical protein
VYLEQENIVLSRAIPNSLMWMVEPAIRMMSRDLVVTSLRQTREAVRSIAQSHLFSVDVPVKSAQ